MARPSYPQEKRDAFSAFVKHRMAKLGINGAEAAQLLDVHRTTFGGWSRGTSIPSIDDLKKLCELFDENYVVVACLFSYPEYRKPEYWLGPDYRKNSSYINLYNECFVRGKNEVEQPKEQEEVKETKPEKRPEKKMAPTYPALHDFGKKLEEEEEEKEAAIVEYCKEDTVETYCGNLIDILNDKLLAIDKISINDSYDGKLVTGFSIGGVQMVIDIDAEEIAGFIRQRIKDRVKQAMTMMED